MFHPDTSLDLPTGDSLLAEFGISSRAVREVAEHDRAMRCPDRGADLPAYGFASLAPEPALEAVFQDAAPTQPRRPAFALPPA